MRVSVKMEQIIKGLATKHGVDLTKPYAYMKLQLGSYMPLVAYNSGDNRLSVIHVNSDHMADPEIVFWIGSSAGWMPTEVTQLVGGRRVYAQPNETGTAIVPISHRRQASLSEFADTWADNIVGCQMPHVTANDICVAAGLQSPGACVDACKELSSTYRIEKLRYTGGMTENKKDKQDTLPVSDVNIM